MSDIRNRIDGLRRKAADPAVKGTPEETALLDKAKELEEKYPDAKPHFSGIEYPLPSSFRRAAEGPVVMTMDEFARYFFQKSYGRGVNEVFVDPSFGWQAEDGQD